MILTPYLSSNLASSVSHTSTVKLLQKLVRNSATSASGKSRIYHTIFENHLHFLNMHNFTDEKIHFVMLICSYYTHKCHEIAFQQLNILQPLLQAKSWKSRIYPIFCKNSCMFFHICNFTDEKIHLVILISPPGGGTRMIFRRGVRPEVWNLYPFPRIFLPQKMAAFNFFSKFLQIRTHFKGVSCLKNGWFFFFFC